MVEGRIYETKANQNVQLWKKNIRDCEINSENLEENIITLSESFLIFAYECYKGEKIKDGQLIDEIIKVMLPSSEEEAKLEWDNGVTFDNKKYYTWFATTGGMKKEGAGRYEILFVRDDFCEE